MNWVMLPGYRRRRTRYARGGSSTAFVLVFQMVFYMHQEKAYKETEPYQIISYDLAKELNELG